MPAPQLRRRTASGAAWLVELDRDEAQRHLAAGDAAPMARLLIQAAAQFQRLGPDEKLRHVILRTSETLRQQVAGDPALRALTVELYATLTAVNWQVGTRNALDVLRQLPVALAQSVTGELRGPEGLDALIWQIITDAGLDFRYLQTALSESSTTEHIVAADRTRTLCGRGIPGSGHPSAPGEPWWRSTTRLNYQGDVPTLPEKGLCKRCVKAHRKGAQATIIQEDRDQMFGDSLTMSLVSVGGRAAQSAAEHANPVTWQIVRDAATDAAFEHLAERIIYRRDSGAARPDPRLHDRSQGQVAAALTAAHQAADPGVFWATLTA